MNLDVAVERLFRILESKVALATTEQRHEDLPEVLAHLRERREEELARRCVDLADRLRKLMLCVGEVRTLASQELQPLQ
jgi:hypothetical protein